MGCGTSMHKVETGQAMGAPQAVAEAEEAALARLREENVELRRQNANITAQVQELSQRLNTLTKDVSGLRTELAQAAATANKALQTSQSALERFETAATTSAAASQARPNTATGPIPIPSSEYHLSQRLHQLESQLPQRVQELEAQLAVLKDKLESQRAKEEFAKQLRAAQGSVVIAAQPQLNPASNSAAPPPLGRSGSNNTDSGSANAPRLSAAAPPRTPPADTGSTSGSNGGAPSNSGAAGAQATMIDGNGLLPANNNFPTRFGGPGGLRPARDRTPGRTAQPSIGGGAPDSEPPLHPYTSGPNSAQTSGPPGGEFMSTHRYGTVLPSDLKLAEQRKQGPKQFL